MLLRTNEFRHKRGTYEGQSGILENGIIFHKWDEIAQ